MLCLVAFDQAPMQARKIYVQHRIVEATKNAPPRLCGDGFKTPLILYDFVVSYWIWKTLHTLHSFATGF